MAVILSGLNVSNIKEASEIPATPGEVLGAAVEETIATSPTYAGKDTFDIMTAGGEKLDYDAAKRMTKDAGVVLDDGLLQGTTRGALEERIKLKKEEMQRQAVFARQPSSALLSAAKFGTSLATSFLDPVNVAAAFVPVVGQARYAGMVAGLGRYGAAAARGAIEGTVGTAAMEPFIYSAQQYIGSDYTMYDSLANIAMGAPFGAGLHVGGMAVGDIARAIRNKRLPEVTPDEPLQFGDATPEPIRPPMPEETVIVRQPSPLRGAEAARAAALDVETQVREELRQPAASVAPDVEARTMPVAEELPADFVEQLKDLRNGIPKKKMPQTLSKYLADRGGLRNEHGELTHLGAHEWHKGKAFQKKLVNEKGLTLDDAALFAWEAGFFPEFGDTRPSINDLLQALEGDLKGYAPVYSAQEGGKVDYLESLRALDEYMGQYGIDIDAPDADIYRALQELEASGIAAQEPRAQRALESVAPSTRQEAFRTAIAQALDGREIDAETVLRTDPRSGLPELTEAELMDIARRQSEPEAQATADFAAAERAEMQGDAITGTSVDDAKKAMELAEDDIPFYSRGGDEAHDGSVKGSTADQLTAAVRESFGEATEALLEAGNIKIVQSVTDLPPRSDGQPHFPETRGVTFEDGSVYVVADNIAPEQAKGLVLHEVGVHVGMESLLGQKLFSRVLDDLDGLIAKGDKAAVDARRMVPSDTPEKYIREETLAYLVQHAPELPLVQRIVAAIRQWVYRVTGGRLVSLTGDDLREMAVGALKKAARKERTEREGIVYEAGGAPQRTLPLENADAELRPYNEAIKKAEGYPEILKAAARSINDEAAMRATMLEGGISPEDVQRLIDALGQQHRRVKAALKRRQKALGADDAQINFEDAALQAALRVGDEEIKAAYLKKRAAALNLAARERMKARIAGEFQGQEIEGVLSTLTGSRLLRKGAKDSASSWQKAYRGEWLGGLEADLRKAGLFEIFSKDALEQDVARALEQTGRDKPDFTGINKDAVKLAEVLHKYQERARVTQNRYGAWIADMRGYIVRQSHDAYKIRKSFEAWEAEAKTRFDLERMMAENGDGSADAMLRAIWSDLAAGRHQGVLPEEAMSLDLGANLAKKRSQSRVIHFKPEQWYHYNKRFGTGSLAQTYINGIMSAADAAGLMRIWGANPQANLTRVMEDVEKSLRDSGDVMARNKFSSYKNQLMNNLAFIDGTANIPGNVTAARVSANIRAWQSMAKLGGVLITSVSDLAIYASEARYQGRKGLLSGMSEAIGALTQGRGSAEQREILSSLGVVLENMTGEIVNRFDGADTLGKNMAALQRQFFKFNGLAWWTDSLRKSAALGYSHYLAQNAGKAFADLPEEIGNVLSLYNVDAAKWDVLRMAVKRAEDGREYLTTDALAGLPDSVFKQYLKSIGRSDSEAAIANVRDDLANALRQSVIDRAETGVIETDAKTRAFMLRDSRPGTAWGEVARFVAQFKSFPIAFGQRVLSREIYGRGYDTLGDYLKNGKGDMLGLAHLFVWMTVIGYGAMAAKDLLKGREPRDPLSPKTIMAAMVQGGGLGIYGDYIFGEYSRHGRDALASLAGPVIGQINDVLDLKTRIMTGDDVAAAFFRFLLSNTPYANLFYVRPVLDYLIIYQMQEWMNPGYLRRMERRIERENNQQFLIRPSQVVG